jgi:hypothetical protein
LPPLAPSSSPATLKASEPTGGRLGDLRRALPVTRDQSMVDAAYIYGMVKGAWPSTSLYFLAHYANQASTSRERFVRSDEVAHHTKTSIKIKTSKRLFFILINILNKKYKKFQANITVKVKDV